MVYRDTTIHVNMVLAHTLAPLGARTSVNTMLTIVSMYATQYATLSYSITAVVKKQQLKKTPIISTKRHGSDTDANGPFYLHGLTLIPAWVSNYIIKMCGMKFLIQFPNFNCLKFGDG